MSKQEKYITFIVDELRKGSVSHKEVFALTCCNLRQMSKRSFDKYWKIANEHYTDELQAIQKQKTAIHTETELNITRANVLNKLQAKEILSQIAKKEQSKPSEKIQAIKTLADLEGWNDLKAGPITITVNPIDVVIPEDIPD